MITVTILSVKLRQTLGVRSTLFKIGISKCPGRVNKLAYEGAILVPIAITWICRSAHPKVSENELQNEIFKLQWEAVQFPSFQEQLYKLLILHCKGYSSITFSHNG